MSKVRVTKMVSIPTVDVPEWRLMSSAIPVYAAMDVLAHLARWRRRPSVRCMDGAWRRTRRDRDAENQIVDVCKACDSVIHVVGDRRPVAIGAVRRKEWSRHAQLHMAEIGARGVAGAWALVLVERTVRAELNARGRYVRAYELAGEPHVMVAAAYDELLTKRAELREWEAWARSIKPPRAGTLEAARVRVAEETAKGASLLELGPPRGARW